MNNTADRDEGYWYQGGFVTNQPDVLEPFQASRTRADGDPTTEENRINLYAEMIRHFAGSSTASATGHVGFNAIFNQEGGDPQTYEILPTLGFRVTARGTGLAMGFLQLLGSASGTSRVLVDSYSSVVGEQTNWGGQFFNRQVTADSGILVGTADQEFSTTQAVQQPIVSVSDGDQFRSYIRGHVSATFSAILFAGGSIKMSASEPVPDGGYFMEARYVDLAMVNYPNEYWNSDHCID